MPAVCPKCQHSFDPTLIGRAKRKTTKREAPEAKKEAAVQSVLSKKPAVRKKDISIATQLLRSGMHWRLSIPRPAISAAAVS